MPIIYLEHPRHGTKVATMEQEAVFDEENGWTRYTLGAPSSQEEAAPKRARRTKTEQPVDPAVPDFLAPQADQGE
jgi:hypothetical protein